MQLGVGMANLSLEILKALAVEIDGERLSQEISTLSPYNNYVLSVEFIDGKCQPIFGLEILPAVPEGYSLREASLGPYFSDRFFPGVETYLLNRQLAEPKTLKQLAQIRFAKIITNNQTLTERLQNKLVRSKQIMVLGGTNHLKLVWGKNAWLKCKAYFRAVMNYAMKKAVRSDKNQ
ncbi:MAG: hypothetical protein O4752_14680 [Trichodesmium sp. St4_bin8_1]|nr:hypothetical protein [Trichodesmium sp. St4_bin8_1]